LVVAGAAIAVLAAWSIAELSSPEGIQRLAHR
jgi:hypothetical protein